MQYNLLLRWFVGLDVNDPGSTRGPDSLAKDPLPTTETDLMPHPSRQNRNTHVDFRSEKRSNVTHASTTDPATRPYRKSPGTGAMLCVLGHALMENRSGLIVQDDLNQADGRAERRAALDMIYRHSPRTTRRLTLGTDKGFGAAEFVADIRQACVTAHVARKSRHSAIYGSTTRHKGHVLSSKHRKRIEEACASARTIWATKGGTSAILLTADLVPAFIGMPLKSLFLGS